VLLFTGNSEIEVDPVAAQLQNVFDKLKALLLPIVFPLFDTVPEMLAALDGHNERAKEFMEAAKELPDFGEHSEYLHFLTAVDHAEKECRFLLDTIGAHLSEMNCETNEHLNKILKGILVRLQGLLTDQWETMGVWEKMQSSIILALFSKSICLNFYTVST